MTSIGSWIPRRWSATPTRPRAPSDRLVVIAGAALLVAGCGGGSSPSASANSSPVKSSLMHRLRTCLPAGVTFKPAESSREYGTQGLRERSSLRLAPNHHRRHRALGSTPPAARLAELNNPLGSYT